jgi:hypothetical protein
MHDDEIPGMAGLSESVFYAFVERLGDAHQREPVDCDRGAVRNPSDSLLD